MGRRERERKIGLCPGRCLSAVCLVLASCLLMAGCGAQAGTEEKEEAAPFHVTALKVGKADALLLWTEGEAVLLDAGEDDDGEEVLEYIEEQGIDSLKAMIITHFDKDHVGGADKILEGCPVETVYYPDYEGDGKQYRQFCEALEASGAAGTAVRTQTELPVREASLVISPSALEPEEILAGGEKEYDNDLSLAVRLSCGEGRMLFLGDAKEQRIEELLQEGDLACDVLKLPHHGRYNDGLPDLLSAAEPEAVIICCSDKNPPEEETLALLAERGVDVWETRNGNIELCWKGGGWEIRQE